MAVIQMIAFSFMIETPLVPSTLPWPSVSFSCSSKTCVNIQPVSFLLVFFHCDMRLILGHCSETGEVSFTGEKFLGLDSAEPEACTGSQDNSNPPVAGHSGRCVYYNSECAVTAHCGVLSLVGVY